MPVVNSIDNIITSSQIFGGYRRFYVERIAAATTAATNTSGYNTVQRYPTQISMPSSFGTGVNGLLVTRADMINEDGSTGMLCGIEYDMGTLTINGSSFSDGVAMPVKNVLGKSVQTCASAVFLVATAALTATAPVITVTYTDQDGNTGQTAQLTLPNSPALSTGFMVYPHLANGDTGIQDITNMSTSTGTAGTLKAYGVLVLNQIMFATSNILSRMYPLTYPNVPWVVGASEKIAFYRLFGTTTNQMLAVISGVADY